MDVTLRIRRFNPETDSESRIETYQVPADPMDRVLDLLHWVKWNVDGSLTFRRSCAHGVCGSDAMLINGANRLACKVLVRELGDHITVEPLRGLPVAKDLLVDMEPFFASYREDFPARDDRNWLRHTLARRTDAGVELDYKPVTMTRYQPMERKY